MDSFGSVAGQNGYFAGNVTINGPSAVVNFTSGTFGDLQGLNWGSGAVTLLHRLEGGVGQGNRVELVSADLKINNNNISGSSGLNIVLGASGLVSTVGDLKVGGNDIQASDGATALTLTSATGDVAVAGDLTVNGGKVTLTNGSTIDSETVGTLLLTEDVV